MDTVRSAKKPDISSASEARGRIISSNGAARGALKPIEFQFRRLALGIKKHAWPIFAVLLTAAVMEFNYYQASLTREYLRAILVNTAQMNGEIDALDAKLNQLNTKIEALGAKLDSIGAKPDKPPPSSSAPHAKPRPSLFSKPW